jgi:hypothetical protein
MRWLVAVTLGCAVLAACGKATDKAPSKDKIAWGGSIDEAIKSAKASSKPVLIHFAADW